MTQLLVDTVRSVKGVQQAREIDTLIQCIRGTMNDHYNPGDNVVRLSDPVATQPSVAATSILQLLYYIFVAKRRGAVRGRG